MEENIAMMKNINIIYSSNLKGDLEKTARIGTLIKEGRQKYQPSLVLNVGNTSWGSDECNYFKGEPMWKALRTTGYEGVSIGPDDFLHKWKTLKSVTSFGVPVTICNLYSREKDERVKEIRPYILMDKYPGMKIGLLGVIDERIELEMEDSVFLEYADNCTRIAMKELTKEKCNLIILMAYMTLERCKELASNVDGIDLIICSHPDQEEINDIIKVNSCLISSENTKGNKLAVVEFNKM